MMKKVVVVSLSILLLVSCFIGCSIKNNEMELDGSDKDTATDKVQETAENTEELITGMDFQYSDEDLNDSWNNLDATTVVLKDTSITVKGTGAKASEGILTISDEGTYILSGTLSEGQIIVEAEDTDKIKIVLNGVNISCTDQAPIYIKQADKVLLTLADKTTNIIMDGSSYVLSDEDQEEGVDATIYSKSDITINGSGALKLDANYKHGIVSKDDLIITGGTFTITAVGDGLRGKDCVKVSAGDFTITAGSDGIQSKNALIINNGIIEIARSNEGLEGNSITITDGTIHIIATDDGLNAAGGNKLDTSSSSYLRITGGYLVVNAYGDGLDSNGDFYVEGGTVFVSGPTNNGNGTLDYNGTASITGGIVVAAGSLGMAQTFGDTSSQYSLMYAFKEIQEEDASIILKDSSDKDVVSFTPDKEYQTVVISAPSLQKGEEYVLYVNGIEIEKITLSSISTTISNGQNIGGPGGMGGQKPGGMKGERPEGEKPQ